MVAVLWCIALKMDQWSESKLVCYFDKERQSIMSSVYCLVFSTYIHTTHMYTFLIPIFCWNRIIHIITLYNLLLYKQIYSSTETSYGT